MDITTPIPDAIQWSEGMLLSPQHFQQNDIYWHQQLWHRGASLQPHYWGVLDFALAANDLQAGLIKIERLHAVLPDGLVVQLPNAHGTGPEVFDLGAPTLTWSEQRLLKLYLCVPIRAEAAASSNGDIRRFDSLPEQPTKDENTGDGGVGVGRLYPRLALLPEDKLSGKYVSFPLLEVRREAGNRYVLTDFHPPLLRLSAAGFLEKRGLGERLPQVARAMREKAKELIGDRRVDDDEAETYANAEVKYQLYSARMLTTALPSFEILVASGTAHPFDLYLALAQLVGAIAAIGADPMPPLLPDYRHDDPMPAFQEAMDFIDARLKRLQVDTESIFFKKHAGESAFTCQLPEDLLADTLLIEIKPGSGQSREPLVKWLEQSRIASDELMPALAERRLPGAQLRAVDQSQVRGIQLRPDALVFEVANQAIDLENRRVPLIRRGGLLKIQGALGMDTPANILLHRTRVRRGASAATGAEEAASFPLPCADAPFHVAEADTDPLPDLATPAAGAVDEILDEGIGTDHA